MPHSTKIVLQRIKLGLVTFALFVPGAYCAEATASVTDPLELWFSVGEKLTYKIYWGFLPVGTSTASSKWIQEDGRRLLSIKFRSKSNKFLSKIYPVDDHIESIIDPATFLPIRYTKKMRQGGYRCDEITHFDHKQGLATWRSLLKGNKKIYKIGPTTRDIVSFMYFMRSKDQIFRPGMNDLQTIMSDEKLYDLSIKPLEIEEVSLPKLGRIPSVKFEPKAAFEGIVVRKGKMALWVSNDEQRVVTQVAVKIPVASVRIKLIRVEKSKRPS